MSWSNQPFLLKKVEKELKKGNRREKEGIGVEVEKSGRSEERANIWRHSFNAKDPFAVFNVVLKSYLPRPKDGVISWFEETF